jgi:hypothetical protein
VAGFVFHYQLLLSSYLPGSEVDTKLQPPIYGGVAETMESEVDNLAILGIFLIPD